MGSSRHTNYTPTLEELYAQGQGESIDEIEAREDRKRARQSKLAEKPKRKPRKH